MYPARGRDRGVNTCQGCLEEQRRTDPSVRLACARCLATNSPLSESFSSTYSLIVSSSSRSTGLPGSSGCTSCPGAGVAAAGLGRCGCCASACAPATGSRTERQCELAAVGVWREARRSAELRGA